MAVVFHGSPFNFPCPECRYGFRVKDNRVIWSKTAVFATSDRKFALLYTANKFDDNAYAADVDLINAFSETAAIRLVIIGGKNQKEALDHLYGVSGTESARGYIYQMNANYFHWEEGLGKMECISQTPRACDFLIKKEIIDRRKELDDYIKKGLIKINWTPSTKAHRNKTIDKPMLNAYMSKCSEVTDSAITIVKSSCVIL